MILNNSYCADMISMVRIRTGTIRDISFYLVKAEDLARTNYSHIYIAKYVALIVIVAQNYAFSIHSTDFNCNITLNVHINMFF